LDLNNTGADITNLPLIVQVSDVNFVRPGPGPAVLSSSVSGTVGAGVDTTVGATVSTFQSTVDYSNTLLGGLVGPPPTPFGANGGDTTGIQAFVVPLLGGGTQDFGNTVSKGTTVVATPFSLSNQFTFTSLSLANGASVQLTGTTQLTAVPAPPTVVLALGGLPALCLGQWLQRRRQQA